MIIFAGAVVLSKDVEKPGSTGLVAQVHVAAFADTLAAAGLKRDAAADELLERCLAPRLNGGNVPLIAGDRLDCPLDGDGKVVEFRVVDVDTAASSSDPNGGVVPEGGCEVLVDDERRLRSATPRGKRRPRDASAFETASRGRRSGSRRRRGARRGYSEGEG